MVNGGANRLSLPIMKHTEGRFSGGELYFQTWQPAGEMIAALVVVHGFGEHSNRYHNLVNHFVPRGYAVHAFDLRGHGQSAGQRGYIEPWTDLREDVAAFLRLIERDETPAPVFMLGHSFGGVVALDYCLHADQLPDGLICSAPVLGEVGIPQVLWRVAALLDRVWPRFSLDNGLRDTDISRDVEVIRALRADPLRHKRGTARLAIELRRAVAGVHAHAARLRTPLLIVHGTADRVADIGGSRAFIKAAGSADKELREYAGGYHELFNDLEKERVLAETEAWVERRVGAARRRRAEAMAAEAGRKS